MSFAYPYISPVPSSTEVSIGQRGNWDSDSKDAKRKQSTLSFETQNSYLEHPDNSQKPGFVMRKSFLNLTLSRSMGHGLGHKANWPPWHRKNMPSTIWPGVRKMRLSGDPVRIGSRYRKRSALFHPRVGGWCEEERGQLTNMPSLFSLLG